MDERTGLEGVSLSASEDVAESLRLQNVYVWGGDNRPRASQRG